MDIVRLTPASASARVASDRPPVAAPSRDTERDEPKGSLATAPSGPVEAGPGIVERIEAMRAELGANSRSRLQIDREDQNGRFVYSIVDPETGEKMRQWPPERYLELVAYLRDRQGGLVDERA